MFSTSIKLLQVFTGHKPKPIIGSVIHPKTLTILMTPKGSEYKTEQKYCITLYNMHPF